MTFLAGRINTVGSCKKKAKETAFCFYIWLISVGATLVVALLLDGVAFGQVQDLPLLLPEFMS